MSGSSDDRSAPRVLRLRQGSQQQRAALRAGSNRQLIKHALFSTALAVLAIGGFLIGLRYSSPPEEVAHQEPPPASNEQVEISESPSTETAVTRSGLSQLEPDVPDPLPQSDTVTDVPPLEPEPVAEAEPAPPETSAAPQEPVAAAQPTSQAPPPAEPSAAEPSEPEEVAAISPVEEPVKPPAEESAPAEEETGPPATVEAAPALPAESADVAINIPKLPAQGAPVAQAVASSRLLGEVFRDCPECPELVVVAPVAETGGFAIGRYEITFANWERCVSGGGCRSTPDDEGWGRDSRPVINLSYGEISEQYLPWLSRTAGATYRLPTAAEWDLAASGGTSSEGSICQFGNIAPGVERGCDDGFGYTAPAGALSAGPFGIHDLHGNVWEWVSDCWSQGFSTKSQSDDASCATRVLRGGSWSSDAAVIAAGARGWQSAAKGSNSIGFRVVRELP